MVKNILIQAVQQDAAGLGAKHNSSMARFVNTGETSYGRVPGPTAEPEPYVENLLARDAGEQQLAD